MPTEPDIDEAFYEGRRHPLHMPFVYNDAVELQEGPDTGLRGTVISAFMEDLGLAYTVELSTGRDIQVSPSEIGLIDA